MQIKKNLTVELNTVFLADVLWFVIPCWLVEMHIHIRGMCCLHLHYRKGTGPRAHKWQMAAHKSDESGNYSYILKVTSQLFSLQFHHTHSLSCS